MNKPTILLFLAVTAGWAQEPDSGGPGPAAQPGHMRRFADHLYDTRDYERALLEYKRCHFGQPENDSVAFNIGLCCRKAGKPDKAAAWFRALANSAEDEGSRSAAFNQGLLCRYFQEDYQGCIRDMQDRENDHFRYRALKVMCLVQVRDWEAARQVMHNETPEALTGETKAVYRSLLEYITQGMNVKRKSPVLSSTLSVVPGLGNVYCKRFEDGFFSLLLVGTFYTSAYVACRNDSEAFAAVLGGAGLVFHLGNIFGSAVAARNLNTANVEAVVSSMVVKSRKDKWFTVLELERERM